MHAIYSNKRPHPFTNKVIATPRNQFLLHCFVREELKQKPWMWPLGKVGVACQKFALLLPQYKYKILLKSQRFHFMNMWLAPVQEGCVADGCMHMLHACLSYSMTGTTHSLYF